MTSDSSLMTSRAQKIVIGLAVAVLAGLFVLGFLAGAAVYGWRAATRAGNEAATVQNLRTIAAVEIQYFNTHNRTFGAFDQLIKEQMLSSKFAGNPVNADGYVFAMKLTPRTGQSPSSYTLNADPISEASGRNHFYLASFTNQIHINPDKPAGPSDPPQ